MPRKPAARPSMLGAPKLAELLKLSRQAAHSGLRRLYQRGDERIVRFDYGSKSIYMVSAANAKVIARHWRELLPNGKPVTPKPAKGA